LIYLSGIVTLIFEFLIVSMFNFTDPSSTQFFKKSSTVSKQSFGTIKEKKIKFFKQFEFELIVKVNYIVVTINKSIYYWINTL